jgi:predicted ATP-grasp superfamily ATP-dependent carboligase
VNYLQIEEMPELQRPTFVAAFRGWNDAGEAATLAVRHLIETWSAQPFAAIDPEELFDFTVARPMIRVTEEGLRDLQWPSNRFFYHRTDEGEGDVVLMLGTEPHLRWRAFSEAVIEIFRQVDASRLVTMGSLVTATLHSRPPPITGFATEEALRGALDEMTVTRARYEGPTGIVGTLHDAFRRADLPAASLWAGLPAYLGGAPNPQGSLALLQALDRLLAMRLDLSELTAMSQAFNEQVEAALESNDEMRAYIADLEAKMDAGIAEAGAPDLPPSGEIIGDLEDFLRRQRRDN